MFNTAKFPWRVVSVATAVATIATNQLFLFLDGYTVKDLIFRWKKGNPLEVNMTKIYLPRFDLRNYEAVKCDSNTTTGRVAA